MTDLVPLGLVYETKGGEQAERVLDGLPAKAAKAERATDSLGSAANKMSGSLLAAVQAIQKQVGELVELARLQQAAAGGANTLAAANDRVAAATMRFSSSFTPVQAGAAGAAAATRQLGAAADATAQDLREVAGAAQMADAHVRAFHAQAMVMPKVGNAATASTKAMTLATLDLSRQFADIGVTAAMGMNPLMILIQQGPQIADAFSMAKSQGVGFRDILANLAKTVGPLMAVLGPLAIIGGTIAAGFAIATHEINKGAGDITKGLGLTEDQLKRLKKSGEDLHVTFGDTFKATFQVAGEYLAKAFEGPIDSIRKAFSEWYAELIENTVREIKAIVGGFIGGFEAIKAVWKMLPAAIGDGVVSAANFVLNAIEKMVNGAIALINRVTPAINAFAKLTNNPFRIDPIADIKINPITNKFAGAMQDVGLVAAKAMATGMAKGSSIVDQALATIAARAVKNAQERILKAAGDPKKGAKGKADPRDMSDERSAQLEQMIAQAKREELQAQLAITHDIAERARIQKDIAAAEFAEKQAAVNRQIAAIEDDKGLSRAKKDALILQLAEVQEIQKRVQKLKIRAIDEDAEAAKAKEALAFRVAEVNAQIALLESQRELAMTTGKRREIEERIYDLQRQIERAKLVELAKSKDPETAKAAEEMLKVFDEITKNQKKASRRMEVAFGGAASAIERTAAAFRNRDWYGVVRGLMDAFSELQAAFKKGATAAQKIGALSGAAYALGRVVGGKAGKVLSGAASGAMAGAQLGSMIPGIGNVVGAVVGGIVGGVTSLLKGKPSNHGALATLTDTGFALAGNKRNAETSEGATQIARAFLQGQKLLQDVGVTPSATVKSVDFGSRDKTDILLSDGRALKTAVGDAGAAAEAGLKAILEGAKYVNDTQKKLVEDMTNAGAGFDEIASALTAWKDKMTAAQGLGQSIADQILKYTDPRGYDITSLQRAQEARAKELADYLAGEFIDQATFDQLSAQLNQLNELELADTLKKYNQAAMDAANDVAAAARETIGNWLDIADSLADYRKSLAAQAAGAASPLAAYRQAKGTFDALAPGVRAGDVASLQSIQSVGDAYIAAARAVAPDAVTVARAIAQVQGLAGEGEAFARSQSGDIYREIADNTAQLVVQMGALTTQLIAAQQTIIEQNKTIAEQTAKAAEVLDRATQGGDSFVVVNEAA